MGWETRFALYEKQNEKAGDKTAEQPGEMSMALHDGATELVDYMLFVDEAPLGDKIRGSSGFTEKFAAEGPFDAKGRSLRQFDLQRRLMRYPCSYMIYSEAFDALQVEAKEAIYSRMWQILEGKEKGCKICAAFSS